MNQDIISKLHSHIIAADTAYHENGESVVSDHEYDSWKKQLQQLNPNDELLSRVGSPIKNPILSKAQHKIPMGSLTNAMNELEFRKWAGGIGSNFLGQPKADGFSLGLYYKNGKLERAITRGDGFDGEDITDNAVKFQQIPLKIANGFSGSVRGEVVLSKTGWYTLDPEQSSNPRNLAAGIGRRKNGSDSEFLSFRAFELDEPEASFQTLEESFLRLTHHGFVVLPWTTLSSVDACVQYWHMLGESRSTTDFLMDGAVIKVNDYNQLQEMGISNNRPKGMIAFKWPAEVVTTTLEDVKWNIGHTGKVIPVACLKPVRCAGVTISSALLCNMEEIKRLGIAIGDEVEVIRAGEVIPKIIGVKTEAANRKMISAPDQIDGHPVTTKLNTGGSMAVDLYIDLNHPSLTRGRVLNWIQKVVIDGLGGEVLDALIETNLVSEIKDLYRLKEPSQKEQFLSMKLSGRKLGPSRANKILDEIEKSTHLPISTFLGSLGIEGLGRRRVELIVDASNKGTVDNPLGSVSCWFSRLFDGNKESYLITNASQLGIPGIATRIQESIDARNQEITELLDYICVEAPKEVVEVDQNTPFYGKTVCFTGVRPNAQQTEALTAAGMIVKSGVSSGLDYLCVADPSSESSKSKKARQLGVAVISIDELSAIVAS